MFRSPLHLIVTIKGNDHFYKSLVSVMWYAEQGVKDVFKYLVFVLIFKNKIYVIIEKFGHI